MKILYHHRIASKDGQYVHMLGLIDALRQQGHEVILSGPDLDAQQAFGGQSRMVGWLKRWTPGFAYELAELAYSVPDYVRLARAIRRHRPDIVYERYNMLFVSGLWARRRYRLPWLVEVNAPLFDERSAYGGIRLKPIARWSERAVWRGADHVFAVTEVLAKRIATEGVPRARLAITPNGIAPAAFAQRPSRAVAKQRLGLEHRVVLGFTGFVREWHGLERVLETMQRLDLPGHFLCVGDGPARAALEQHARGLGLGPAVTFTGVVGREQVLDYVDAFDVALQPAVVAYASPLKLFEYMAAGCAIVAPDLPNIREVLVHGDNALLFDPDAPGSFSAAVARLADDAGLRQRLGDAARATIKQRGLTWPDNAKRVVACADALLARADNCARARPPGGSRG